MKRTILVALACLASLAAPVAATSDSASEPRITRVVPAEPTISSKPQLVTVTGDDFATGLTLSVTSPSRKVQTFSGADISAPQRTTFQVSLPLDAAGTYSLVVTNPDGGTSMPFPLQVRAAPAPQPRIEEVKPSMISRSREPQVVTLVGTNFANGLKVSVTDPTGTVTNVDTIDQVTPGSVVFKLTFEQAGQYEIMVTNPTGATSNTVNVNSRFAVHLLQGARSCCL